MRCRWCAFAIAVASLVPQGAFGQDKSSDATLTSIFSDWQHRQGLLKTARYVVSGTIEYKDDVLPPGNTIKPRRIVLLLDLEKKRFWLESQLEIIREYQEGKREYIHRRSTQAFDGKVLQALTHREENRIQEEGPDLAIVKGDLSQKQLDAELRPLFFAHGIIPTVHAPLRPGGWPTTYDSDILEVRGRQSFDGRTCTVVRTEVRPGRLGTCDELWIDSSQKSAIIRHISFSGSNPWFRTDVKWKQTDFGWWPDHWTFTWTTNGKVRRIQRLRIESFEPNPVVADSDFVIPVKPGMVISVSEYPSRGTGLDPSYAANRTYRVSPSGSWEEQSTKGFTTLEGKVLPPERNWPWVGWIILVVVVVASMYYLFHRVRRKRTLDAA